MIGNALKGQGNRDSGTLSGYKHTIKFWPGAAFVAGATSLAPGYIPEAFQAYVPAIGLDTLQHGALNMSVNRLSFNAQPQASATC